MKVFYLCSQNVSHNLKNLKNFFAVINTACFKNEVFTI